MIFTKNVNNSEKKTHKPHKQHLLQVPQTFKDADKTVDAPLADRTIVFIKEI
jgi:hypothetical protein